VRDPVCGKLIGVRYGQVAEYRMDPIEGAGAEDPAAYDFLNTRCLTIADGTEQILLTLATERLLGLPRWQMTHTTAWNAGNTGRKLRHHRWVPC
jgi:hypothetical protein